MQTFLSEMWKRRVVQLGAVYLATAWVLLQVALAVEQTLHLPDWVGQVVLLFLVVGFPVLLILAWTREPHTARAEAAPSPEPRLAEPAAALSNGAEAVTSGKPSVCVLPFANMSDDPQQEYFSDGITEDIITDLSQVSALSVIARNTAFTFKGQNVDVPHIARQLKVSHVLEGSVRKAGGRLRITAQLIDGAAGDHVWAKRYDRDLNDIFAIQDEISEAIVAALKVKLLPEEKKAIERRGTDNVEAYNLFLMARQEYVTDSVGDPRREEAIVRLCQRATEIDPNYAQAWALMALAQVTARFLHGTSGDGGLAAAERALAIDGGLAEAHAVKARVLAEAGRVDDASAEIEAALALDPDSWEVHRMAGITRLRQQRLKEAVHHYEMAIALEQQDYLSSGILFMCCSALGDHEGVRSAAEITLARVEKVLARDPDSSFAIGFGGSALAALGQGERAREWMSRSLAMAPNNPIMRYTFTVSLLLYLKDQDAALDMLGPFFARAASGFIAHVKVDPDLASIREHPRFKAMVAEAEARIASAKGA